VFTVICCLTTTTTLALHPGVESVDWRHGV